MTGRKNATTTYQAEQENIDEQAQPLEEVVAETTARGAKHLVAIVLGLFLAILGLGLTFTIVLFWLGIPLGVVGLLMLVWGFFAWRQG